MLMTDFLAANFTFPDAANRADIGRAKLALVHAGIAVHLAADAANMPAVGANGTVVQGGRAYAVVTAYGPAKGTVRFVILSRHTLAKLAVETALIIFLSAVHHTVYIFTFPASILRANGTYPAAIIAFYIMDGTNAQVSLSPFNMARSFQKFVCLYLLMFWVNPGDIL